MVSLCKSSSVFFAGFLHAGFIKTECTALKMMVNDAFEMTPHFFAGMMYRGVL